MTYHKFEIWIANLNPRKGTEPGKIRPVLIVQTDLLNVANHTSSLIIPFTTNVIKNLKYLRIHVDKMDLLDKPSDLLMDQVRAIDNQRLIKKVGFLPEEFHEMVNERLRILFDI